MAQIEILINTAFNNKKPPTKMGGIHSLNNSLKYSEKFEIIAGIPRRIAYGVVTFLLLVCLIIAMSSSSSSLSNFADGRSLSSGK